MKLDWTWLEELATRTLLACVTRPRVAVLIHACDERRRRSIKQDDRLVGHHPVFSFPVRFKAIRFLGPPPKEPYGINASMTSSMLNKH